MITLASTAMPTVSRMPAMPGSDSEAFISDSSAVSSNTLAVNTRQATTPNTW
jgi:hypothetical protein